MIFTFPAIDYQQQLIFASLDDFTPNDALSNYLGGQFGWNTEIWRQAVIEFLCINIKCELIELTHHAIVMARSKSTSLKDLLIHGDPTNNISIDILWNALYFNGTSKLTKILEDLDMHNWNAIDQPKNQNLIYKLTKLYEDCTTP
ncbi:hypothetical protein [Pararobbsia silviterrae]|uniref:hypothetical protein n=1 Tax=Pararobbsia silviterrae TaxID=1792498 RepID=UPI0011C485CB|nr:hypothetical protein [Pararobbsia silviterrae]